jgi:hypothetical protein
MKTARLLSLLLVLCISLAALSACLPTETPAGGGSSTTTTTAGNGGESGGGTGNKPETVDGTYSFVLDGATMTYVIDGENVTCTISYENGLNLISHGTVAEEADDDETTVKYAVTWTEHEFSGTNNTVALFYNAAEKTLTTFDGTERSFTLTKAS